MAGTARLGLNTLLYDGRQRSVRVREPIRRIELIVDLRLRVGARTALQPFRCCFSRARWRSRVGYRICPDQVGTRLLSMDRRNQQQSRKCTPECSHKTSRTIYQLLQAIAIWAFYSPGNGCILQVRFGAGFPAPKYGYFRLTRIVTVTVTAITAETLIKKIIIVSPFRPDRNSPGLLQTGRGSVPGPLGRSQSPTPLRSETSEI